MVLVFSGDLGSSQKSLNILKWLLSWISSLTLTQISLVNAYFRKTFGHFCAYGFLYFLWFRAFRAHLRRPHWRACLWSLAICLGTGLLDEGHQAFFLSRGSSLMDVALDMSGAATVALIISLVRPAMGRPEPGRGPRGPVR